MTNHYSEFADYEPRENGSQVAIWHRVCDRPTGYVKPDASLAEYLIVAAGHTCVMQVQSGEKIREAIAMGKPNTSRLIRPAWPGHDPATCPICIGRAKGG